LNPEDRHLPIETLPSAPGSYALHLRLPASQTLQVGRCGLVAFPAGEYIYLGSALGPGGLRGRLGRHLRGDGRPRWHIDALRAAAEMLGAWWACAGATQTLPGWPLECRWSQTLSGLPGAFIPAPGFGAGDCRSGCRAHLVGFPCGAADLEERIEEALSRQGIPVNCWYNWGSLSPQKGN
jgi:Uri superfamily endonuclease